MKKVLLLCGYFDYKIEKDIINYTKGSSIQYAANSFQSALIKGLKQNNVEVQIISAPFIGAYPFHYKKHKMKYENSNNEFCFIEFNNLWGYKNILFSKDKFYYIDFELSDHKFIFYDVFTLIFFTYVNHDDPYYYIKYIAGDYDNDFEDLLSMKGIKYKRHLREDYFKLFLIERIIKEIELNKNFNKKFFFEVFKNLKNEI